MKAKVIGIVSLALNAVAFDVQAVTVRGMGSCGEWAQEVQRDGKPSSPSAFWMLGYLSGIANATNKDVLKDTDTASIYGWITNYCKANPLDKIGEAGDSLFIELKKRMDSK